MPEIILFDAEGQPYRSHVEDLTARINRQGYSSIETVLKWADEIEAERKRQADSQPFNTPAENIECDACHVMGGHHEMCGIPKEQRR